MRAIDIHVHPTDARVARAWAGEQADAERFFRGPWTHEDLDATAERFRSLDVLAVLLGVFLTHDVKPAQPETAGDGASTPVAQPVPSTNGQVAGAGRAGATEGSC